MWKQPRHAQKDISKLRTRMQIVEGHDTCSYCDYPFECYTTPVLRDLHWLPVVKRCQFKILVFTYKSLKNEAPSYISDLLNWYQPNRPLRSANTTSITPKRYKSVRYGKRLMDTGAAMRWNSLPNELKCAITTNCF